MVAKDEDMRWDIVLYATMCGRARIASDHDGDMGGGDVWYYAITLRDSASSMTRG
jgi:hypothetical protein